MTTLRSLGRWWVPLAGLFLILTGIGLLFNIAVPTIILGLLALLAGIFALCAS